MKKKFYVGALVSLMSIPMVVNAAGVSTVKFEGNTNVNVGDEFNVNMVIDNVEGTNGGVVAFGGYINYDKNVLELVSTSQADNKYEVLINRNINKIAALDYTLANGIKERTNVYTMTFKAINEGNSVVTLTDGEFVDTNSEVDYKVEGLEINANNRIEENTIATTDIKNSVNEVKQDTKVEYIKNAINKFFKRG